jgi:glutamate dehydrogenase/leucine dehydrogenase
MRSSLIWVARLRSPWKCAVAHIPFGGGGIICDPTHMPRRELEAPTGRDAEILYTTGPEKDAQPPDVKTNDRMTRA